MGLLLWLFLFSNNWCSCRGSSNGGDGSSSTKWFFLKVAMCKGCHKGEQNASKDAWSWLIAQLQESACNERRCDSGEAAHGSRHAQGSAHLISWHMLCEKTIDQSVQRTRREGEGNQGEEEAGKRRGRCPQKEGNTKDKEWGGDDCCLGEETTEPGYATSLQERKQESHKAELIARLAGS